MQKLYTWLLSLSCTLAFGALVAGPALATELVWLANGKPVPSGGLEAVTSFSLSTIVLAGGFLEPEIVFTCAGAFDGLVLTKGEDTVEDLLSESKTEITLTNTLSCTNVKNCPTPLMVTENLPWKTQLSLMEGGSILDLYSAGSNGPPAYEISCDGLSIETLCEGETSAVVELMTTPAVLLSIFKAAELETESLEGGCESHVKVLLQEGSGEVKLVNGEELSAGEEIENSIALKKGILDFGEVSIGAKKPRVETDEFESTVDPVDYEAIKLANTKGSGFAIKTATAHPCAGKYAAKALCEIEISFTPELPVGEEFNATLELEYEDEATKVKKLTQKFSLKALSAA